MRLKSPFVAVAAMFFLNGAFYGAWASRIPTIKSGFDLSPDALGLLLLLLAGGAIISFPVAGRMIDRFGAARVTHVVAIGYAISLAAIGISPSLTALAIFLFVFGVTHGAMDVAMNAWGTEVEKRLDLPILPQLHAVFSFGAGAGALFGALAITAELTVFWHFFIFSILASLPCFYLASIGWVSDVAASSGDGKVFALPSGSLLLVGVIAFCGSLGEGAMVDWSAVYLVETVQATESLAAIGFTVFSIAMVVTRLSGTFLIKRLGNALTGRLSGIFAFSGLIVAVIAPNARVVLCGYALMGLGYALIVPLAFSRAANDPNQSPGTAIASVATLGYGGLLLGPPIIGFIAARSSYEMSFSFLAVLALGIILLAPAFRQSE